MQKINGISVSSGISISKIKVLEREEEIEEKKGAGIEIEKKRSLEAFENAKNQIENIMSGVDGDEREIFEAHLEMLSDPEVSGTVENYIDRDFTAEYAVYRAKEDLKQIFIDMEDEYFRARANDVEDIMTRVIKNLLGKKAEDMNEEYILVSDELYPSETLEMDFRKIKGIATLRGSKTSHTTILANNFNIPALISLDCGNIYSLDGKVAILDAESQELIVEPEEDVLSSYEKKIEKEMEKARELKEYISKNAVTKSGKKLNVFANIGSEIEADEANKNGAEGIGLFRSEFLYLGRKNPPDEEEQYRAYKLAVVSMKDRPVIVRTMDIGADKQVDYLDLKKEDNPQMGLRGIRLSLSERELFKTQLRALLRASYYGDLRVMLPMVISPKEILETREIIDECLEELKNEKRHFKEFKLGIMIETPAAAIIADELGKYVDFFSIGTNDLVSYTLAIDRTNNEIAHMRDDYHPAIKRLIELTVAGAKKNDIEVGICGAMGADPKMLDFYLDIGLDEVSVSLNKILEVKRNVINAD